MARRVELTVDVKDEQFKQFQQNFNDLSAKIKDLSKQFKTVQSSIDDATTSAKTLTNLMKGLLDPIRGVHTEVEKVTKHFGRWTTLIGGVVMMIGAGTGLWGIDRFSKQMLATRRQMLGYGTSNLAGVQAAGIAGQTIASNPEEIISSISQGIHGDLEKQQVLRNVLRRQIGPNEDPAEVFKEWIQKVQERLSGQRNPLALAESMGIGKIQGQQVTERLAGPGGRDAVREMLEDMAKQPAPMGKEALKAWSDLNKAYQNFTTNLKNRIGEALSGIAVNLTEVSKGLTKTIDTLLKWPIVIQITDTLKDWAKRFGDWLESDETQKNLKQFGDDLDSYVIKPMEQFADILNSINEKLGGFASWLRRWLGLDTKPSDAVGALTPGQGGAPADTSVTGPTRQSLSEQAGAGDIGKAIAPKANAATATPDAKSAVQQQAPISNEPTMSFTTPDTGRSQAPLFSTPTPGGAGWPTGAAGIQPLPGLGGRQTSLNFMGAVNRFASTGGAVNRFTAFGGAGGAGGNTFVGGSTGGVTQMASVVNKSAPGKQSGWAFLANSMAQNNQFNVGGGPGRGRGPLEMDNWQSTRTATLRLDNIAGANVHTTATGMS